MNKIIKVSAICEKILRFLVFILLPASITLWAGSLHYESLKSAKLSCSLMESIIAGQFNKQVFLDNSRGFILLLVLVILQTYGLWQLKNLFGFYARGKIFTANNSVFLRRAAVSFLIMTALPLLIEGLLNLSLTGNNLEKFIWLSSMVRLLQFSNILLGIVLIVFSRITEEGRRLRQEINLVI